MGSWARVPSGAGLPRCHSAAWSDPSARHRGDGSRPVEGPPRRRRPLQPGPRAVLASGGVGAPSGIPHRRRGTRRRTPGWAWRPPSPSRHHRSLETRVLDDLADRLLQGALHDLASRRLVASVRPSSALLARRRVTPPPGTMPSSTAARVGLSASSTRAFFSFISVSVAAPTRRACSKCLSRCSAAWTTQARSTFPIRFVPHARKIQDSSAHARDPWWLRRDSNPWVGREHAFAPSNPATYAQRNPEKT
jgi:hypothetical protein